MGRVLFEKKIRTQSLPSEVGLEDGLRNRFNRCLFSGKIDSQELIKKAFHHSYLKRNLIIKSRNTYYSPAAGPEPSMVQGRQGVGRGEEAERNDHTTIRIGTNGVGDVERKCRQFEGMRKIGCFTLPQINRWGY